MQKLMTFAIALLPLLVLAACQTPMQTGNQCVVAPGFLAGLSTFTWRTDKPVDVNDGTGYVSPLVERGLADAVIAELSSKGFSFVERIPDASGLVDQPADIEIALTLRTRRELVSVTVNNSPCLDADCWERIDPGSSTRMDTRTVGFMAADVYLPASQYGVVGLSVTCSPRTGTQQTKSSASLCLPYLNLFHPDTSPGLQGAHLK